MGDSEKAPKKKLTKEEAIALAKARKAAKAAEAAKKEVEEPKVDVDSLPLVKAIKKEHAEAIEDIKFANKELTITVKKEHLLPLCRWLKSDPETAFDFLSEVIGVHYPKNEEKPLQVVYHLFSTQKNHRLRLKVNLGEGEEVESVYPVWRSANWYEREAYDMVGIRFANHPDLRRILLPDDWEGHPLRKEYPLQGPEGYREKWLRRHCRNTNAL
jgi:NADH-quinone oxidoreductase subunit C